MNELPPAQRDGHGGTVLPEWLARRAALTPGAPALTSRGETWTFAELDARAAGLALRLQALLRPEHGGGARIAILMGNTPSFVAAVHAVPKMGGVLVPLNHRLTPRELGWQLEDAGVSIVLHDGLYAEPARRATFDLPSIRCVNVDAIEPDVLTTSDSTPSLRKHISLDDLHSIVYTSGTTGQPKGALLTYGNFWWNVTASALNLGVVPGDRWLACMPLFHVGGLSILLRSVVYGMPVSLQNSFDAAAVNKAIDEDGVTLLSVVAVMLDRMLTERGEKPYPSSLRAVLVGGGPAPKSLLERAAAANLPTLQTYGLTETASQVATLAPADALRKLGSAGKPLFPTRLRIVSEGQGMDGPDAAVGQVGEIAVAGPTVSPGYWSDPRSGDVHPGSMDDVEPKGTDGCIPEERWFRTGDLGYLDEDGYLYVVDRRDDLIVSGGENVYPAEVEAVLSSHADIREAAVVGVPDDEWGHVPVAVVVARRSHGALDEDAVRTYCRERLAAYKVPTHVLFAKELPRNASGKLLRREVRAGLPKFG